MLALGGLACAAAGGGPLVVEPQGEFGECMELEGDPAFASANLSIYNSSTADIVLEEVTLERATNLALAETGLAEFPDHAIGASHQVWAVLRPVSGAVIPADTRAPPYYLVVRVELRDGKSGTLHGIRIRYRTGDAVHDHITRTVLRLHAGEDRC